MIKKYTLLALFSLWNYIFLFGQDTSSDSVTYSGEINYDLLTAAYYNDSTQLFKLLEKGADVNFESYDGITALMYAVGNNHFYNTRVLVANGADMDKIPFLGDPALITACMNGNFDIAEYLIRKDADINIKNNQGLTPLLLMVKYDDFYMTDMLLYYGANPDIADDEGNTPLIIALKKNNNDIAKLLISAGATINKPDDEGFTPLMVAIQESNIEIVRLLLENGAMVNYENKYGFDALSMAIKKGDIEITRLLIENGAHINKDYGNTFYPVNLSRIYRHPQITALLKSKGGKANLMPSFRTFGMGIEMPFNTGDFLLGAQTFFYDQKYKLTFEQGFQFRPSAVRILTRISDHKYYQFWERRFLFYAGIKRQNPLFALENRASISVDYGAKLGYTWGSYRGSDQKPEKSFLLIPNAAVFYAKDFINTGIRYEYLNFDNLYKSPHMINVYVAFTFGGMGKKLYKPEISWLEE